MRVLTLLGTSIRIDDNRLDPKRPPNPKEDAFCDEAEAILVKEAKMEYADVVRAYRQIEEKFVNHAGYDDREVLETKRRIAESIFTAGCRQEQPFEVCRDNWNALVDLGFSTIETFSNMTWFYADCCLLHRQYEMGLALVEPLIAEFETALADPTCTEQAKRFYNQELEPLRKIRDELASPP